MRRTADRPLPTRRVQPYEALWLGLALTVVAELYLALFTNPLTSILGLTVVAGYLFAYTPLKTRTTFSTFVGAFPGAMPPVLGWTAARGQLDTTALVLFVILFLWQFPHFSPSRGCTAKITDAPASACCPWSSPTAASPASKLLLTQSC